MKIMLCLVLLAGCSSPQNQPDSSPAPVGDKAMVASEHTHYHVHTEDISHEHAHEGSTSEAHTHDHQHSTSEPAKE